MKVLKVNHQVGMALGELDHLYFFNPHFPKDAWLVLPSQVLQEALSTFDDISENCSNP